MKDSKFQTEQEIIVSLQGGSITAYESLFKIYSQKLYRFSYSYLKSESEAEDVVQEVFLKLWENRSKLKTGTSFQSYLFKIAFNSILKSFNKKNRQGKFRTDLFELLAAEDTSLKDQVGFEVLFSKLDLLIEQMPARRKEIFLKRKKEGSTVRSIALEMKISDKTVENQITEAMNFLRKSFDKDKVACEFFFLFFIA